MTQVFLHPDGDIRDVEGEIMAPLVYVSREKRPGHEHNKKAGAMNALVRASALITNRPFVMNLDCDHYVNNSDALREVTVLSASIMVDILLQCHDDTKFCTKIRGQKGNGKTHITYLPCSIG